MHRPLSPLLCITVFCFFLFLFLYQIKMCFITVYCETKQGRLRCDHFQASAGKQGLWRSYRRSVHLCAETLSEDIVLVVAVTCHNFITKPSPSSAVMTCAHIAGKPKRFIVHLAFISSVLIISIHLMEREQEKERERGRTRIR